MGEFLAGAGDSMRLYDFYYIRSRYFPTVKARRTVLPPRPKAVRK